MPRSCVGLGPILVALTLAGCRDLPREAREGGALGLAIEQGKPTTGLSFSAQAPRMTREEFAEHANDPGQLTVRFERRGQIRQTQAIVGAVAYELRAIYTEAIVRSPANLADFHMGVKARPDSLLGYSLNVPPQGSQVAPGAVGVGVLRYAQHPTLDDPLYPSLIDPTKTINPVTGPGLYFLDRGILRTEHDGFPPPVRDVFGDVPSRIVPSHSEVDNIKLGMASVEYLLGDLWKAGLTCWTGAATASVPSFTQDRPLTDNRTLTTTRYYKWRIPFSADKADFGTALPLGRVMFDVRVIGADGQAITFGSQAAVLGAGSNLLNIITWANGQGLVADAGMSLPPYIGPPTGSAPVQEAAVLPTPMPTARPGRRYTIVATVAGTGLAGLVDGAGNVARFNDPVAGAVGANGDVYVADFANNSIRVLTPPATGGTAFTVRTLPGSQALLRPSGVAVDAAGNVYVGDHEHSAIVKIAPGGQVSTLASGIGKPRGVAVASDGTVYFASDTGHFIGKIAPSGLVTRLAGSVAGNVDAVGEAAKFFNPYGIAFDLGGNILVADSTNSTIRRVDPVTAAVTTIAGTTRGDLANPNRLDHAAGVVADKFGNVFIADTQEHKVRVLTVDNTIEDLAGTGTTGSGDGPALQASFNLPYGITIDASGDLYVFETGNDKVRIIR